MEGPDKKDTHKQTNKPIYFAFAYSWSYCL